jgi:hypothetical protein
MSIPLPILGALIVGGVTLVALLTRWVPLSTPARVADLGRAREQLAWDSPDVIVTGGLVADDHASALVELEGGGSAVVFVVGDKLVSRVLGAGSVRRVGQREDGLDLRLTFPGVPRVSVQLGDPEARAAWAARLGA